MQQPLLKYPPRVGTWGPDEKRRIARALAKIGTGDEWVRLYALDGGRSGGARRHTWAARGFEVRQHEGFLCLRRHYTGQPIIRCLCWRHRGQIITPGQYVAVHIDPQRWAALHAP